MRGLLVAVAILASGCSGSHSPAGPGDPAQEDAKVRTGFIRIEDVAVRVVESSPRQVIVHVRGVAPAPCWALYSVDQVRAGNRVSIFISAIRRLDVPCGPERSGLDTFEQDVTLHGPLSSGLYVVRVNGGAEHLVEL